MSSTGLNGSISRPHSAFKAWRRVELGPIAVGFLIFLSDAIVLQIALFLGLGLRRLAAPWFPISIGLELYLDLAQAFLLVTPIYLFFGLHPSYGINGVDRLRRRVVATTVLFAVLLIADHLRGNTPEWSRGALLSALVVALPTVLLADRLLRVLLVRLGHWGRPVVLLGAGRTGALIARRLQEYPLLGLRPVAFFDDDPRLADRRVEGLPVLGRLSQAAELRDGIDTAIFCIPSLPGQRLVGLVQGLAFPCVTVVPDLFGIQSLGVHGRDLGGVLGLEIRRGLLRPSNRAMKVVLDYLVAIPALLLALPLQLLAAVLVYVVDPGPVLYAQQRRGRGGQAIWIWKLRTMYCDAEQRLQAHIVTDSAAAEEWRRYFKLRRDPRVLPVIGAFLRRMSIDELPQLWNVLKGEMSIVGPRPFPDYHLAAFDARFLEVRHSVSPGITGFWQVSARSDGDVVIQERLDAYYVLNWSLWLDLYILARTAEALLTRRGAR